MYDRCALIYVQYMYTREQFLNLNAGLGLNLIFVCLLRFSIFIVCFCVGLYRFIYVLHAFIFFRAKPKDWLERTSPK